MSDKDLSAPLTAEQRAAVVRDLRAHAIPFESVLAGNGFDDLGQLQFHGPFLVRDGKFLFPVPLHLLGRAADHATLAQPFWLPSTFLSPNLIGPVLETALSAIVR